MEVLTGKLRALREILSFGNFVSNHNAFVPLSMLGKPEGPQNTGPWGPCMVATDPDRRRCALSIGASSPTHGMTGSLG
jgi:hypothetical protein